MRISGVVSNNQIEYKNRTSKKTKHKRKHRNQRASKSNVEGLRNAIRKLKSRRRELDRKLLAIDLRTDEDARMRRLALISKLHRVSLKLESAEHRFELLIKQVGTSANDK